MGTTFTWAGWARWWHLKSHSAIAIVAHHGHRMLVIVIVVALVTSVEQPTSTSRRNRAAKDVIDDLSSARKLTTSYGIKAGEASAWGGAAGDASTPPSTVSAFFGGCGQSREI